MKLESIVKKTGSFIKNNKSYVFASTLMLASAIVDSYLTISNINSFGIDIEANKYARGMIQNFGLYPGVIGFKSFACLGVISASITLKKVRKDIPLYVTSVIWGAAASSQYLAVY